MPDSPQFFCAAMEQQLSRQMRHCLADMTCHILPPPFSALCRLLLDRQTPSSRCPRSRFSAHAQAALERAAPCTAEAARQPHKETPPPVVKPGAHAREAEPVMSAAPHSVVRKKI